MQQYRLVFDVATNGYRGWHLALFPALIALGSAPFYFLLRPQAAATEEREDVQLHRVLLSAAALLATIISLGIVVSTWSEYEALRTALQAGRCQMESGRVTDFVPELADGHPREQFSVGQHHYLYSSSDMSSAFHWTYGTGGPIRAGQLVRICEVNGAIVRLEILR